MLNRTDFSKSIKLYGAKTFWIVFFLFHASCTFYMVEFFHEIIQYLVNVNIKLKLQIWISRYPCFNVVRRNKTSLLTINWSLYWVKDDAITKKLLKKHYQVGTFCKNSTSWVFTQNIPSKNLHVFFYIIYNLRNIFPFINNIYLKYIRK